MYAYFAGGCFWCITPILKIYDGGGQFIDRGYSYTLAVYYQSEEEKSVIDRVLGEYDEEIFVSVERYKKFYEAEEYHQDYYLKHPKEFEEELIASGRKSRDPEK